MSQQRRPNGPQVRPAEPRNERDSRASARQQREQAHIQHPDESALSTVLVTIVILEGVVHKRHCDIPRGQQHALEINLHAVEVQRLRMRHEGMERGEEREARRHAEVVGAADEDIRGGCRMVSGRDGDVEDESGQEKEDHGTHDV